MVLPALSHHSRGVSVRLICGIDLLLFRARSCALFMTTCIIQIWWDVIIQNIHKSLVL